MACRSLLTLAPALPNASSLPPTRLSLKPPPSSTAVSAFLSPPRGALGLAVTCGGGERRGAAAVVRAGRPSTNSLLLAFLLPFSLLVGTVFASLRMADRLDEQYLEELAMNEAIMEEKEAEGEDDDDDDGDEDDEVEADGDGTALPEKEEAAAVPRARDRPRRRV